MRIRHLNHSCLLIEAAGTRLLVDPGSYSADQVRALGEELAGLDAVLVTHQHADHLDRALLAEVLAASPLAEVIAEPETAAQLAGDADGPAADGDPLPRPAVSFVAGSERRIGEITVRALGGRHAIIHPDIPRVGNVGYVIEAEGEPRLGITGDSLEPVAEFHGIDVLAFAVVAPWSRMEDTIDFLRRVRPRLALPVHDAIVSPEGRPIFIRQSTALAPEGTEVRDWDAERTVTVQAAS